MAMLSVDVATRSARFNLKRRVPQSVRRDFVALNARESAGRFARCRHCSNPWARTAHGTCWQTRYETTAALQYYLDPCAVFCGPTLGTPHRVDHRMACRSRSSSWTVLATANTLDRNATSDYQHALGIPREHRLS